LRALDASEKGVSFFECPSCRRQYVRAENGSLNYYPVSRPLYCILFSKDPVADAPRVAIILAAQSSTAELGAMTREIELELEQPTQQVRDLVDGAHSEETCRQFLAEVAKLFRARLGKSPPPSTAVE
jgi:hypothetical protein